LHAKEIMMVGNQHNDWGHSDVGGKKVTDEDGAGATAENAAGTPGTGGQAGQNSQNAGASASSSGVYTNFQHADPESNVNPAGAAQNSHGSATGPLPGGVEGQYQASQNAQSGMGAAAAGGNPGTSQGGDDAASGDRIHGAGPDGGAPAGNGSRQG
jgi:hypothetical protein